MSTLILINTWAGVVPLDTWLRMFCEGSGLMQRFCECQKCVLIRIDAATTQQADAEAERAERARIKPVICEEESKSPSRATWVLVLCVIALAVFTALGRLIEWP